MEIRTFAHAETTADRAVQMKLRLREDRGIYRFAQLRHRNGRAVAFDRVVLPHQLVPGFDVERMSVMTLHEIAQQYGWLLGEVVEEVNKVTAPADVAELLGLTETEVLELDRVTFTASGQPLEWRVIYSVL
jgi:DNA-binding GntR family transcriptional regulator